VRSRAIETYKTTLSLSGVQREMLVGILLGDACLETQNAGRTYRLKIEQGAAHADYVQHLYEVLREWVLSPPRSKRGQTRGLTTINLAFQTVSHEEFRRFGELFYRDHRKIVPEHLEDLLTARGLAYWYMDDGSMKSSDSKGVLFNTHAFRSDEIKRLIGILAKFGLVASERRQSDGLQIYVSGRSYERFVELVDPYVVEAMRYKVPQPRRTHLPKK
jgi:LAGLIDADG DNA endonuclease family protein